MQLCLEDLGQEANEIIFNVGFRSIGVGKYIWESAEYVVVVLEARIC